MESKLLEKIYTLNNLNLLILYLKDYSAMLLQNELRSLADKNGLGVNIIKTNIPSQFISMIEGKLDLDIASSKDVDSYVAKLEQTKKNASVVYITVADIISSEFLTEIVRWLRNNIKDDILVEFNQDPSIIGGVMIRNKNKMFDYSYKALLEANKEKVNEIIKDGI